MTPEEYEAEGARICADDSEHQPTFDEILKEQARQPAPHELDASIDADLRSFP